MKETTRSEFLKTAGSFALFSALGISIASCSSEESITGMNGPSEENEQNAVTVEGNVVTVDLTDDYFSALTRPSGMAYSDVGGFLAVNIDGTIIRAFTNVCTHAACSNQWSLTGETFVCNCHNSVFNTAGQPTSGPAERDLTEYGVSRSDNTLTITK